VPGAEISRQAAAPLSSPSSSSSEWVRHALRTCTSTYLRLERMALGDAGAEILSQELLASGSSVSTLRALYLGENGIGDAGARALAEALKCRALGRLRRLYMQENPVSGGTCGLLRAVCDARGIELIGLPDPPPPPRPRVTAPPRRRGQTPPVSASPQATTTSTSTPLSPPSPSPIELLPCNRARAIKPPPPQQWRARANLPRYSASGGAPTPPEEPRFRATRPSCTRRDIGELDIPRYDVMPCSRARVHPHGDAHLTLDERLRAEPPLASNFSSLAPTRMRPPSASVSAALGVRLGKSKRRQPPIQTWVGS
jgi:hypothetical protein